jgi:hypothetical protein
LLDYDDRVLGDETIPILGSGHDETPGGRKHPKEFGPLVSVLVFLPVLAIVAVLQMPVLLVAVPWRRWKHRRFVARMQAQNRVMIWSDFARCMEEKRGTLIIRGSQIKWLDWWWTEEDIRAVSPHPVPERTLGYGGKERLALLPFRDWCYARYMESTNGRALLVLGEVKSQVDLLKNNPDANVVVIQPLSRRIARRLRAMVQNERANRIG